MLSEHRHSSDPFSLPAAGCKALAKEDSSFSRTPSLNGRHRRRHHRYRSCPRLLPHTRTPSQARSPLLLPDRAQTSTNAFTNSKQTRSPQKGSPKRSISTSIRYTLLRPIYTIPHPSQRNTSPGGGGCAGILYPQNPSPPLSPTSKITPSHAPSSATSTSPLTLSSGYVADV